MVDLCAGSGAIGLSVVSEVPGSQVWAVELSPNTAEWTRRNLSETAKKYPSIASNYHLEIADATSFATLAQLDGTVDIVITNPPYVPQTDIPEQPEVRDWDPELALYGGSMDGTLIPERIIERACRLLKPGGVLVMEHDVTQGDRLVALPGPPDSLPHRPARTGRVATATCLQCPKPHESHISLGLYSRFRNCAVS